MSSATLKHKLFTQMVWNPITGRRELSADSVEFKRLWIEFNSKEKSARKTTWDLSFNVSDSFKVAKDGMFNNKNTKYPAEMTAAEKQKKGITKKSTKRKMPKMKDQLKKHNNNQLSKKEHMKKRMELDEKNAAMLAKAVSCLSDMNKDERYYQGDLCLFIRDKFERSRRNSIIQDIGENSLFLTMWTNACINGKDDQFKLELINDFI